MQSLLAVGTASTKYGPGQIYVLGRNRIWATLPLPSRTASVKTLQFCSDRLLCLDDHHDLNLYSLLEKKLLNSYSPPGSVTAIASDPTLDYVIIGMGNGDLLTYDLDRESLAPFRVPCLWAERNPRARHMPIVSLQFHPRDIGKILIGYSEGAVIFSFKKDEARTFLHYQLARGAPGGDGNPAAANTARSPQLIQALWQPTGTFVLSAHEDSSMVIWDPKDGRVIMARSLTETNVDKAGIGSMPSPESGRFVPRIPLLKIAWCSKEDPDDTGILIAGGTPAAMPSTGLTFLELGRTPTYATSSWQVLADHFGSPKRQRILPTPPNAEVVEFSLIPRKTPWYAGAHDPVALIALMSTGEVTTMSFPSAYPITPTNQLHLSMTFVYPFVTCTGYASVDRNRWLGLTETRPSGPKLVTGGAEAPHPLKRYEDRSIFQTAHADGTIRIWDAGHGDEIENELLLQADISGAVGRLEGVTVTRLSLSGASGELVAGLQNGEVVIFKWAVNKNPGRQPPTPGPAQPKTLTNIADRKDPGLAEGFHPFTLLNQQDGPVTALKVSDVGFIAAGFQAGTLVIIDMRGPAIIFSANIQEHAQKDKGAFRKRSNSVRQAWPTCFEFSVMTLDNDPYSSILLHAGTSTGNVTTFKILPGQGGRYSAEHAGTTSLDDSIVSICPFSTMTGQPAHASQQAVVGLRNGAKIEGALLVASHVDARIFKPATAKGAHKTWDSSACQKLAITQVSDLGKAAVGIFSDGTARAFSLPGLREIAVQRIDRVLETRRLHEATVTSSGDILGWTGPSEIALLNVWGTGENQYVISHRPHDRDSGTLIPE